MFLKDTPVAQSCNVMRPSMFFAKFRELAEIGFSDLIAAQPLEPEIFFCSQYPIQIKFHLPIFLFDFRRNGSRYRRRFTFYEGFFEVRSYKGTRTVTVVLRNPD